MSSIFVRYLKKLLLIQLLMSALFLAGCTTTNDDKSNLLNDSNYEYVIGAGDRLDVFVWRNTELSVTDVPVRPDGKISTPLVSDMLASGKTPGQLAQDISKTLSRYIKDPYVTIIVREFIGDSTEQIRVIGEAATPKSLSYRKNMTVLDVMISVGGLTEYAAGNKSTLIRNYGGVQQSIKLRLRDLLQDGDISANIKIFPGDVIIIPEAWF